MEATLSGAQEDVLINSLSLGLSDSAGASYVTNRREATHHSAIPICSYQGVNVLRIVISSATEWAALNEGYLAFTIQNDDSANALQFVSQPHIIFSRLQVRCGTELEDIADYNRLCEMFLPYQSAENRLNNSYYGLPTKMANLNADATQNPELWTANGHVPEEIGAGESRKVCMTMPLSSIFGQANRKFWPCWATNSGLELLLTLSDPASHVVTTGKSVNYKLTDIRFVCPMLTLDSSLQEKYFASLARGDALLVHTKQFSSNEIHLVPSQGSFSVSVNRPVSRLATVFASYSTEITSASPAGVKYCNNFAFFETARSAYEHQLTCGSKMYPEMPVKGIGESWIRLMAALGVQSSLAHSIGVSYSDYVTNRHVISFDMEKIAQAAATGTSTQAGNEIRLDVKGLQNNDGTVQMKRAWIVCHYDQIVEIRAGAVSVLN